jgi:FkbH-like protein
VLLAVCSKNNHDDAVEVLDGHPEMLLRSKDFHAIKANWDDKATNLMAIAAELNVGVDSIAFLDDNPAERSFVGRQLPMVTVLPVADDPAAYAPAVRRSPLFERLSLSEEDRQRSGYYERERQRSAALAGAATLEGFLESLRTRVDIFAAGAEDIPRVAQLTQKTNQFNVTTRRYTEPQIAAMVDDEAWAVYALRAADRFGEHGLVGVALVDRGGDDWRVDTLLLSCRVIGRQVETALIHVLSTEASARGAGLIGEFSPTAKNAPAADFYDRHGFMLIDGEGELRRWRWAAERGVIDAPAWIEIASRPQ